MSDTGIGIIGRGVISGIYLANIPRLPGLALRAVCDLAPDAPPRGGRGPRGRGPFPRRHARARRYRHRRQPHHPRRPCSGRAAGPRGGHAPIEIHGTEGSARLPDPNRFDGAVELSGGDTLDAADFPCGAGNWHGPGLCDMAAAIREGRPHRTDAAITLHVLEAIEVLHEAARAGASVAVESRCDRAEPMPGKETT